MKSSWPRCIDLILFRISLSSIEILALVCFTFIVYCSGGAFQMTILYSLTVSIMQIRNAMRRNPMTIIRYWIKLHSISNMYICCLLLWNPWLSIWNPLYGRSWILWELTNASFHWCDRSDNPSISVQACGISDWHFCTPCQLQFCKLEMLCNTVL